MSPRWPALLLAVVAGLAAAAEPAAGLPPLASFHVDLGDDIRADARHRVWSARIEPDAAATLRLDLDGAERLGRVDLTVRVQRHPAVLEVALVDDAGVAFRAEARTLAGHGAADTWTIAPDGLRDAAGMPWTARPARALLLIDRTGERTADHGEQVLALSRVQIR